jgi:hypothetical protein
MSLPTDLINRLCAFLNFHELSCIADKPCTICTNFRHLRILDKDIDENLIKNYCKSDKNLVDKIPLKKLTNKAQRIHVIGNHWPLVNSFKHRKFAFFCKSLKPLPFNKDSVCITDTNAQIGKYDNKLIVTQGYESDYNLESVDYLMVEKKYVNEAPFDIPESGFLVVDLRNGEKFYTE